MKSLLRLLAVLLLVAASPVKALAQGGHQHEHKAGELEDAGTVGLELVAEGMVQPVALTEAPGGSGRLFIVDQVGVIQVVTAEGTLLDEPFLDLRDRIVDLKPDYDERGLVGIAFHPDYEENGRFFVHYSAPLQSEMPDNYDHTARVSEFRASSGNPDKADPVSERVLLEVAEPQTNHNGGTLAFGPEDGYLYISLGDGGGADDQGERDGPKIGHVPDWYERNGGGNGQDVEQNLLGNILRIDVDGRGSDRPYGIPEDNPFVDKPGLDEVYAYGFRNPYRFSFDMGGDHDLLVGDAGQEMWEEVSVVTKGGNYGWNVKEGTHCFDAEQPKNPPKDCPDTVGEGHPRAGAPLIDPVIEWPNAKQEGGLGLVVVGGYVYRGDSLPQFAGDYIHGTWSTSHEQPKGRIFVSTPDEEGMWGVREIHVAGGPENHLEHFVLGFGQDLDGELYVLTTDTSGPKGNTGKVWKMVPSTKMPTTGGGGMVINQGGNVSLLPLGVLSLTAALSVGLAVRRRRSRQL